MLQENKVYQATLKDAGIQANKNSGNPEPFMAFEIEDEGTKHTIYWTGNLKSEASQKVAADTLKTAGFIGASLDVLQTGVHAGSFAPTKITLKLEAYKKDGVATGKFKVKYVNGSGGKKYDGVLPNMAALFAGKKKQTPKEEAPF